MRKKFVIESSSESEKTLRNYPTYRGNSSREKNVNNVSRINIEDSSEQSECGRSGSHYQKDVRHQSSTTKKAQQYGDCRNNGTGHRPIPPPLQLPPFLPKNNSHDNWSFSRVYSQEIYEVYDKHIRKFDGEYLSNYLLGEIFYERISDNDAEFDQSVFFQALQVTKKGRIFKYGDEGRRIALTCGQIPTANNSKFKTVEKRRTVIALSSLAELIESCVNEGDILVLFGDIVIEKAKIISLNSRQRHPLNIVHYRHERIFRPEVETDPDSPTAMLCRNKNYCHAFHEFGNNEVRYQVEPNVPRRVERMLQPDEEESQGQCLLEQPPPQQQSKITPMAVASESKSDDDIVVIDADSPPRRNSRSPESQCHLSPPRSTPSPRVHELQQNYLKSPPNHTTLLVSQVPLRDSSPEMFPFASSSSSSSSSSSDDDESSSMLSLDIVKEIEQNRVLDSGTHSSKVAPSKRSQAEVPVSSSSLSKRPRTQQQQHVILKDCYVRIERLPRSLLRKLLAPLPTSGRKSPNGGKK